VGVVKRTLVKRLRRKVMGGLVDIRIYSDGRVRGRCNHPSNDPEIEMAMAGRFIRVSRELFLSLGIEPIVDLGKWRSDP
jgi:hypothetical protein